MAYTKTTWVTNETALSADNMNHIEDGIANNNQILNSLIFIVTEDTFSPASNLQSQHGTAYSTLKGNSAARLTPSIPNGYRLIGHCGLTINGFSGLYISFDEANAFTETSLNPFIYNTGSSAFHTNATATVRLCSLCIKNG